MFTTSIVQRDDVAKFSQKVIYKHARKIIKQDNKILRLPSHSGISFVLNSLLCLAVLKCSQ